MPKLTGTPRDDHAKRDVIIDAEWTEVGVDQSIPERTSYWAGIAQDLLTSAKHAFVGLGIIVAIVFLVAVFTSDGNPPAEAGSQDDQATDSSDALNSASAPDAQLTELSLTQLKERWGRLEEECRGGQHAPSDATCRARDDTMLEIEGRGVCWAWSDWRVSAAEYAWHPCSQPLPRGWQPD